MVETRAGWIANLIGWDRKRRCAWLIPKKESDGLKSLSQNLFRIAFEPNDSLQDP